MEKRRSRLDERLVRTFAALTLGASAAAAASACSSSSATASSEPGAAAAVDSGSDVAGIDGTGSASGTVTLTAVNADGSYNGSYDLTFQDGSHVTGAFASVACAGLAMALGTTAPTCN